MKKYIIKLFKYELMQYDFGRRYIGGKFYYMDTALPMAPFWTDTPFTNCQAQILLTAEY